MKMSKAVFTVTLTSFIVSTVAMGNEANAPSGNVQTVKAVSQFKNLDILNAAYGAMHLWNASPSRFLPPVWDVWGGATTAPVDFRSAFEASDLSWVGRLTNTVELTQDELFSPNALQIALDKLRVTGYSGGSTYFGKIFRYTRDQAGSLVNAVEISDAELLGNANLQTAIARSKALPEMAQKWNAARTSYSQYLTSSWRYMGSLLGAYLKATLSVYAINQAFKAYNVYSNLEADQSFTHSFAETLGKIDDRGLAIPRLQHWMDQHVFAPYAPNECARRFGIEVSNALLAWPLSVDHVITDIYSANHEGEYLQVGPGHS